MAKTQTQGFTRENKWGEEKFTGKVETRKVRKAKQVEFPVTVVDSRAKRIKRALVG